MKNALPAISAFLKLATFSLIYFLLIPSFAQKTTKEYDQKVAEKLATFDLSFLQSELFLNKSFFTTDEIASYRKKSKNAKGQTIITTTADEWESLYKRLVLSDVNEKNRLVEASAFR